MVSHIRCASRISIVFLALLLAAAAPASAFVYTIGQGWQELNFDLFTDSPYGGGYGGTVDDPWDPFSLINTPWTFSVANEAYLRFTDVGDKGDFYKIWNNGVELFTTPEVPFEMATQLDPALTWLDGSWSGATLTLGPGSYSLNFQNVLFADGIDAFDDLPDWFEGASTAHFRVDSVPEPTGLALMGIGLIGLVAACRRRKQS